LSARGRCPNEVTDPNLSLELSRINVPDVAKAELVIGVNDVEPTLRFYVKGDDVGTWVIKPECLANRHGSATKVDDAIIYYMNIRDS
jgi:hypothetical protein